MDNCDRRQQLGVWSKVSNQQHFAFVYLHFGEEFRDLMYVFVRVYYNVYLVYERIKLRAKRKEVFERQPDPFLSIEDTCYQ